MPSGPGPEGPPAGLPPEQMKGPEQESSSEAGRETGAEVPSAIQRQVDEAVERVGGGKYSPRQYGGGKDVDPFSGGEVPRASLQHHETPPTGPSSRMFEELGGETTMVRRLAGEPPDFLQRFYEQDPVTRALYTRSERRLSEILRTSDSMRIRENVRYILALWESKPGRPYGFFLVDNLIGILDDKRDEVDRKDEGGNPIFPLYKTDPRTREYIREEGALVPIPEGEVDREAIIAECLRSIREIEARKHINDLFVKYLDPGLSGSMELLAGLYTDQGPEGWASLKSVEDFGTLFSLDGLGDWIDFSMRLQVFKGFSGQRPAPLWPEDIERWGVREGVDPKEAFLRGFYFDLDDDVYMKEVGLSQEQLTPLRRVQNRYERVLLNEKQYKEEIPASSVQGPEFTDEQLEKFKRVFAEKYLARLKFIADRFKLGFDEADLKEKFGFNDKDILEGLAEKGQYRNRLLQVLDVNPWVHEQRKENPFWGEIENWLRDLGEGGKELGEGERMGNPFFRQGPEDKKHSRKEGWVHVPEAFRGRARYFTELSRWAQEQIEREKKEREEKKQAIDIEKLKEEIRGRKEKFEVREADLERFAAERIAWRVGLMTDLFPKLATSFTRTDTNDGPRFSTEAIHWTDAYAHYKSRGLVREGEPHGFRRILEMWPDGWSSDFFHFILLNADFSQNQPYKQVMHGKQVEFEGTAVESIEAQRKFLGSTKVRSSYDIWINNGVLLGDFRWDLLPEFTWRGFRLQSFMDARPGEGGEPKGILPILVFTNYQREHIQKTFTEHWNKLMRLGVYGHTSIGDPQAYALMKYIDIETSEKPPFGHLANVETKHFRNYNRWLVQEHLYDNVEKRMRERREEVQRAVPAPGQMGIPAPERTVRNEWLPALKLATEGWNPNLEFLREKPSEDVSKLSETEIRRRIRRRSYMYM